MGLQGVPQKNRRVAGGIGGYSREQSMSPSTDISVAVGMFSGAMEHHRIDRLDRIHVPNLMIIRRADIGQDFAVASKGVQYDPFATGILKESPSW